MIQPSLALPELDLVLKDLTPMLHQDLVHSAKVPTHPTISTEAHPQATGVEVVLLLALALDQAPTLEICLTLLLLAGFLLAKAFQAVLAVPVAPTLLAVLDLGATTLSHQALVAQVVPVLMRPLRFLPTKERLPALVPLKTRNQPPLAPVLIEPRLPLPGRWPLPPTEPKSLAQGVRQPSHAPTPPVDSKPSVEEVKQTAAILAANGQAKAEEATKAAPTGPRNHRVNPVIPLTGSTAKPFSLPGLGGESAGKAPAAVAPTNVQDATSAARAAVAVAMAQLGNGGGNAMDNLTNKVNEMRVNAVRGGPAGRGRGRGGRPMNAAKVVVPDSDFDFAQSNAKFNKQDAVKEAIAGSPLEAPENLAVAEHPEVTTTGEEVPVAYNKTRSFFDNISSESRERTENGGQKPGGREWRGEEQRKNMETFGQGSVDGGYRNYRGRGRGRGRGGRGYGRGGRGGAARPQYPNAPPQQ
ncbi:hypothetical protein NXS19_010494 [Fusarium pseudograminearum]|nr:hypothetical protein NXS19_010494 [Fusarium pseudograminearum]